MPISKQMQAASARAVRARKLRLARLAGGKKQLIPSTPAVWVSENSHIPDYHYIESEGDALIEEAQRRLMWGHRLYQSGCPFAELMAHLDKAIDKAVSIKADPAKVEKYKKELQQDQEWMLEHNWKWMQLMRDIKKGLAPYPTVVTPTTSSRRKKMKNRTREERIADLRKALAKQE